MLMKNTVTGEVRDIDPASIPAHKQTLWDTYTPPDTMPPLSELKQQAKLRVGQAAEAARGKYITLGAGKSMSYQEVAKEAARYQATNGAGSYPFLQARINSGRYTSLAAAAAGTIAIEAQWAVGGAAIDEIEDRAKLAIDAAASGTDVAAAEQVEWP